MTEDELRAELERQALAMTPDDQLRLLRVIAALQAGAPISGEAMRELSPDELREWADRLARPADG
jgi:hypothetical protein